ncbi:MAG: hypothetical protein JO079_13580 [Frankiaceae bacterium]|nr:hypothetical protein [Frankiaceae bacterium]
MTAKFRDRLNLLDETVVAAGSSGIWRPLIAAVIGLIGVVLLLVGAIGSFFAAVWGDTLIFLVGGLSVLAGAAAVFGCVAMLRRRRAASRQWPPHDVEGPQSTQSSA